MIIKICGLTDPFQAYRVSEIGATHIGVIHFPKSPRHIDIEKIKEIKNCLKGRAKLVAVVVNPDKDTVKELLEIVDIVQFHGDEDLRFIKQFPQERVFKAFRVKGKEDLEKIKPYADSGYTVLIDAFSKEAYGGTGKQIDPDLARYISKTYKNIILSGGLSPENIEELVEKVRPIGVDASSKLEVYPGFKDLEKVKVFIEKAKKSLEKGVE